MMVLMVPTVPTVLMVLMADGEQHCSSGAMFTKKSANFAMQHLQPPRQQLGAPAATNFNFHLIIIRKPLAGYLCDHCDDDDGTYDDADDVHDDYDYHHDAQKTQFDSTVWASRKHCRFCCCCTLQQLVDSAI